MLELSALYYKNDIETLKNRKVYYFSKEYII